MILMLVLAPGLLMAASASAADPWLVRIDRGDCLRLSAHRPAADVEYRPGVDVRGRPVAAADIGGGSQLATGPITIPIEIDLAHRHGVAAGRYTANAEVGTVTLRGRQVLFNGQPMSDFDQSLVAQACHAAGIHPP